MHKQMEIRLNSASVEVEAELGNKLVFSISLQTLEVLCNFCTHKYTATKTGTHYLAR